MTCRHACGSDVGPVWSAGDLTASHMLYEGSFNDWYAHWESAWRIRVNDKEKFRNRVAVGMFIGNESSLTIKEICNSVSPYLLKRVPAMRFESAYTLYNALEIASQPFRFMDLPADIRLCIYRYVPLDLEISPRYKRISETPPLLACCKHVRREALPLASINLYLTSEHLDIFNDKYVPTAQNATNGFTNREVNDFRDFRERLRLWAVKPGRAFVDVIRRLTIEFSQTCDCCDVVTFEMEFLLIPSQEVVRGCCEGSVFLRNESPPWSCRSENYMVEDKLDNIDGALAELNSKRFEGGLSGEVLVKLIVDALPFWNFLRNY
jgi:hypothetical protein